MEKRIRIQTFFMMFVLLMVLACGLPTQDREESTLSTGSSPSEPPSQPADSTLVVPQSPTKITQPDQGEVVPRVEGRRPWPDTWTGIHVFNDQLASWSMTDEQWQFAATHYAGAQKMTRPDSDRLRLINPDFLILHYRLGIGLGYRIVGEGCRPDGEWISIIEGGDWVQEWPGDDMVNESWFYHWPEDSTTRVLNCDWGWYLAELDDGGWRDYWHGEILRQVQENDSDGVFMDSLSVPNFLGSDRYDPHLPDVDAAFENTWSGRIQNWLSWLQGQPLGNYYLVPNVGNWITSRDMTDYSTADGAMVEGFAMEADTSPYNMEDWGLEMDRTLAFISQGKAVIAQTTVMGDQERMFTLGSYLLLKDHSTYMNIELGLEPEWWPEYDIPIGAPLLSAPQSIEQLYDANYQLYRREYDNGLVLVNPTSPWDGTAKDIKVELDGNYYLAQTSGGGMISEQGSPVGTLTFKPVTNVSLPPYSAAVLLTEQP